jgi:hypothetical protein
MKKVALLTHRTVTIVLLLIWGSINAYMSAEWHYQYGNMVVFYNELVKQQELLITECSKAALLAKQNENVRQKLCSLEKKGVRLRYPIKEDSEPGTQPIPKNIKTLSKKWWGVE